MVMKRPELLKPNLLQRVPTGSQVLRFKSTGRFGEQPSEPRERPGEAIGECATSVEVDKPRD